MLGQKLTLQVSKSKVTVGEPFQITVNLDARGSGLKIANINEFDVYQGPYNSMSTSLINGVLTQSHTLTYIIGAKKEGKVTLGPASMNSNGNTLQSNSVVIEVVKGKSSTTTQGSTAGASQNVTPPSDNIVDNIFVRTSVNKSHVYMGEVIDVTFKVYTRLEMQIRNFSKFPAYDGFFVQDIKDKTNGNQTTETINGVTYMVGEVYKTYAIPQHTGKLTIDPYEVECLVRQKSKRKPRDLYEMMTGGYEDVLYKLKSQPVNIEVKALPEEGKPADFTGAVGNYTYKAALSKEKVKANEALNLTLTISGKGNIKLIEPLKVNFPEDFETYDVKTNENISVTNNGISGSKTFDYLFIPRHEGDYKIDPVNFSYFDPAKREYVTLTSPAYTLHVDRGEEDAATVVGSSSRQSDLRVLGNDIRYIKTESGKLKEKESYFFGSALFYSCLISPILAFMTFILLRKRNLDQNKDAIAVKSRKATKMARKRLSLASQHLKSNNKELFYIEIFRSLYGYLSDKLNIPVSDLNKEFISEKLKNKQVSGNTIGQLMSTLDNCEYARYAPGAVSGDLQNIYNSTVDLITKIEDEVS
ncbi:MAG TPA: BatD family protein [Bacteroidia bacterium]|jgi:hypothetical protein